MTTRDSIMEAFDPSFNPMGTNGFEFIEFTSPNPKALTQLFEKMNMVAVAKHKTKAITLFQQGDIHFLLNETPNSFASHFASQHGPSICGMAFRVEDAQKAANYASQKGAKLINDPSLAFDCPTLSGIGESALYLVDHYGETFYQKHFEYFREAPLVQKDSLTFIDHLTHNVHQGNMDTWYQYYQNIFNFREIRYFDINGKSTGLLSRALTSPCNKIRIPLNESKDAHSQIEEYLHEYKGEGIQHIALHTNDIYSTLENIRKNGVNFLSVPDAYYNLIDKRLPHHKEDIARMRENKILIDGDPEAKQGLLLQIFTKNVVGPIFFEIIQRKGNEGFGEGNFTALFEAMEQDQRDRGVLS